MSALSHDIRTSYGMRYYTVTGPAGAVTWKIPTGRGVPSAISLHYPTPVAGSNKLFSCEFVHAGCYPDFAHVAGERLGGRWEKSGRDDEVIWAELEDWYASKLARLAADQAGGTQ